MIRVQLGDEEDGSIGDRNTIGFLNDEEEVEDLECHIRSFLNEKIAGFSQFAKKILISVEKI